MSVLFVDLVGFTSASERRDAEETREALDRYFGVARTTIERHGGRVEKFIGDAVMALWGAPTAHEDDAERAVRAALQLVEAVDRLGEGHGALAARAAVMTGEAAVSLAATDQAMVAGDIVNAAARLQAAADPGSVLVDETTRRAVERAVVLEDLPDVALRGRSLPVRASRAVRVVAGVRGAGRDDRVEAPFVGRSTELALLKDLFHATAADGRLRLASITGQAGIGKSRLAWELEKYTDGLADVVWWHHGRSPSYGEGLTFWALAEMVRRRAGIGESDDAEAARTRVRTMLETFVEDEAERRRIEEGLAVLLGLAGATAAGPTLEKGELFAAWRTLFEQIAGRGPTILVFEDLHWADAGLLDFVEHLVEWSRTFPIFVVTLARPELHERRAAWGAGKRNFTNIHLEPLPDTAMAALLGGLVPGLDDGAIRQLVARAEGVPLYAVETVRMLLADGTLEAEADGYRLTRPVDRTRIPETLQALVAARVDALASGDRSLLQHAAVLGQSFTHAALAAVSGRATPDVSAATERLVRTELLRVETDPRSPERGHLQFLQAVVRDVVYATISRRERRDRHLAAARYFEATGDDELAAVLATHYDAARETATGDPEAAALTIQARRAFRAAAERAERLQSHGQSLAFFERAIALATEPADRAELEERAGAVAIAGTDLDAARRHFEAAIEVHRASGDATRELLVSARLAGAHCDEGQPREAVAILTAAREHLADEIARGGVPAASFLGQLGRAHFLAQEDIDTAMAVTEEAIAVGERADALEPLVDAIVTKGSLISLRNPREGRAVLTGAIDLCRTFDLPAVHSRAIGNLMGSMFDDDPVLARKLLREGADLAARRGIWGEVVSNAAGIANGLIETLDWDGALAEVGRFDRSAFGAWTRLPLVWQESFVRAFRGETEQVAALDRERDEICAQISNPEYLLSERVQRAWTRMGLGAFEPALALLEDKGPAGTVWWYHFGTAAMAAILTGDLATAEAAVAEVERTTARGRVVDAEGRKFRAALAAMRGEPGADAQLGAAATALGEVGLPFTEVMTWVLMAVTLPPGGELRDRAERQARERLAGVGAVGFLGVLDLLLADRWGTAAHPDRVPSMPPAEPSRQAT